MSSIPTRVFDSYVRISDKLTELMMLIPQQTSSSILNGNRDRYVALDLRKEILQEFRMLTTPSPSMDGFEDPYEEEEAEFRSQPPPRLVIREIPPTPNVIVTKQDYETLLEEPDLSRILRVESKEEISEVSASILKTPETKAPKTKAPEEEEEEVLQEEEDAPEEEEEEETNTRQTIVIKGVAHTMDTCTSVIYTLKGDPIGKLINGKLVRNSSEK
jgi:hypothetical protein